MILGIKSYKTSGSKKSLSKTLVSDFLWTRKAVSLSLKCYQLYLNKLTNRSNRVVSSEIRSYIHKGPPWKCHFPGEPHPVPKMKSENHTTKRSFPETTLPGKHSIKRVTPQQDACGMRAGACFQGPTGKLQRVEWPCAVSRALLISTSHLA